MMFLLGVLLGAAAWILVCAIVWGGFLVFQDWKRFGK